MTAKSFSPLQDASGHPPRRPSTIPERGVRRTRGRAGFRRVPWLVAVPAVGFLLAFHIAPTVAGGYYAFTDWDGISPHANVVGFDNFTDILTDSTTSGALLHTMQLTVLFVIFANAIGLALALGLHRQIKSRNFLRSLFFLPAVVSPVVVSFLWQYMLHRDGIVNEFLTAVGLESLTRSWLADPGWALWAILIVMIWQFSGLCMVIYLAGLESVPEELLEAAAVDGAGMWRRFRRVTLPLLAPAITICMTLTLIFGLRAFDQVIALTGGGPVDATETLATQVWKQTFSLGQYGKGAALALILSALIAVLSISQALILRAKEVR